MSSSSTVTKIKAIKPGETFILPSNAKIIKTIVTNGSVSSSCSSQNLNQVSESKVKYALVVDSMDELSKEDSLIGLGFNGVEYLFPSPIPFHDDMKAFANGTWTNENGPCSVGGLFGSTDNCVGIVKVFKQMKTLLPGGDVLFSFDKYVTSYHDGPSSGSDKDNMSLQSVEFYSFPSIAENRNFYLIRSNQPGSADAVSTYYNNSDHQISYVFPIIVDV